MGVDSVWLVVRFGDDIVQGDGVLTIDFHRIVSNALVSDAQLHCLTITRRSDEGFHREGMMGSLCRGDLCGAME